MPKHFNKGIAAVKIIVILVVVAVVAFGAALALNYWWQPKEGDFDTPEATLPEQKPAGEGLEDETADLPTDLSSEVLAEEEALATEDWQTYRNKELGFEIKYPNGWQYEASYGDEEKTVFMVGFIDELEESLIMLAVMPKSEMSDDFGDFSTIAEAEKNWQRGLEEDLAGDPESKAFAPSIEITTVNSQEVLRATYPPDPIDGSIDADALLLKEGKVFWLRQTFTSSLDVFNQMLSTFKFTPTPNED